jgi:putative ABC transport system permease protein
LINADVHPVLAALIAVIAGMGVGFINAALHVYLKIDPLLAGIIVMIALYTPNVVISSGNVHTDKLTVFTGMNTLYNNLIFWKILILLINVAAIVCAMYWFFGTELGLSLRASGKNQTMAKAQGINTDSRYILGMILSAALISLSGALYAQMTKHMAADAGKGSIVIGLTIIFLGDILFNPKSFKLTLVSIVVGGLLYWLILDIIIEIPGFNTNYLNLMKALFITLIVCVYEIKKYVNKKKVRHAADIRAKEAK